MNKFNITTNAAKRIKVLLLNENKGSYFRISILGGGCSGFQYDFSFTTKKNPTDRIFSENGIKCLIDKESMPFVDGSKLDYVDELGGSFFSIQNPNATANCGCGTSFSV